MTVFSKVLAPFITLVKQASPPDTPDAGTERMYIDDADGLLKKIDESDAITEVGGGAVRLIEAVTPTGTGTVSFTSIPADYKKLIIEYIARGTQSAGSVSMDVTLNNDTTDANYRREIITAYASVGASPAAATGDDNVINDAVIAATGPSGEASIGHVEIPFYANTAFNKQIFSRHGQRRDTSSVHEQIDQRWIDWESAGAVNRVDFILASGNFDTGSEFRLYGVL